MMWYEVLKIEETKDTKRIRKAYSTLLKEYSPEKNPEMFQEIRKAYEEGNKAARELKKEVVTPEKLVNPVDEFMQEVLETYNNYGKRINVEVWRALLNRDICYNIETSKVVSYRMLEFIMEHYYFPGYIYSLFNSYFSWDKNLGELYETFNRSILDYIGKEIYEGDTFKYEYLLGVENGQQDRFIHEYKEACSLITEENYEAANYSINICKEISPNDPNLMVITGWLKDMEEDYNGAIEILTRCIEMYPDAEKAYYFRGEAYYQVDKMGSAVKDFEKALELDPNMNQAIYWLALVNGTCAVFSKAFNYIEELKRLGYKREDMESLNRGIFTYYIKVLKDDNAYKNPQSAGAAYWTAKALFETGDYKECIDFILKAFKKNLVTTNLYYIYCRALLKTKDPTSANKMASKVIEKCSTDYSLYFVNGDALQALGKYEESLTQYKKALDIEDKDGDVFCAAAHSFYKIHDYENTIVCANNAIALNNMNGYYYVDKINALLDMNYFEEAYYQCENALDVDYMCLPLYGVRIRALALMGRIDEALEYYEEVKEVGIPLEELKEIRLECLLAAGRFEDVISEFYWDNRKNPKFLLRLGIAHYNHNSYEKAEVYLRDVIKYDKTNRDAYIYLGSILKETSTVNNRIMLWEKAGKNNAGNPWEFFYLAGELWYNENNSSTWAISNFNKALALNPNYVPALNSRGLAYAETDKLNKAIIDIDRAIKIDPMNGRAYEILVFINYAQGKKDKVLELYNYIQEKGIEAEVEQYLE